MPTYNLRLDVPVRALINTQLLFLLQEGGTLWDAKNRLFSTGHYAAQFSEENVDNYKPAADPALAISLLYCTVVVPREFLDLPENHQVYRDFDAQQVTKCFATMEPAMDSYLFIRCLRNSVAHALFSITEPDGEACDEFHTEQKPFLKRAMIGHKELIRFINVVGVPLTSAVLAQKRASG